LALFRQINGDPYLSQLTARHLDTYKTWRLGKVKPVTANIEIRALRAALNSALRWKIVEANPFIDIRPIRVEETQPAFFSKSDFQKLMNVMADAWLKEISLFAVLTGMRQAEITNLRWENVDLNNRLIHIQSGASFKTKQGKCRTIPANAVVLALLQKRAGKTISDYVFTRGEMKIGESYLTHRFKYWVTEAGLGDELHFHSLRHTFASWLVQDGVSLYEVQKLLGHSSSKVTEIYSHLQPEQMHNTVNRIDIALN
jgi:integrase